MARPHESSFSYSITKPYPFRWFAPVAYVGLVVAAAVFSFLNFASNAYVLAVQTTTDPNATVAGGAWFDSLPGYFKQNAQASCQSANLAVGSQLFTNQTALTYTLAGVWREDASNGTTVLPSLTYFSNPIEQCVVNSIDIDLESLDRSAVQISFCEWGATVRPFITCAVQGDGSVTFVNLTASYDYVPTTATFGDLFKFLGSEFLARNETSRASLYWGESLLSMYWGYTSRTMEVLETAEVESGNVPIRKGTMSFYRNGTAASSMSDPDFFAVDYQFTYDAGAGDWSHIQSPSQYPNIRSAAYLSSVNTTPAIFLPADTLAKSMYATVLMDLGQVSAEPSLLADPEQLQFFTSNFSTTLNLTSNAHPGPITQDYESAKDTTGPLGVTPSVLSTTYICQVPQLKSTGDIFLAVLVADLVFIQALWTVFTWVTNWWMMRTRPDANVCRACADRAGYAMAVHGTAHASHETQAEFTDPSKSGALDTPTGLGSQQLSVHHRLLPSP